MRIRTTVPFWAVAAVLFCFNLPLASAQDYWEEEQSYDEPSQSDDPSHDDSTDEEYVDKSTSRDLQSRFRTVGGLKRTIADEEIVD